MRIVTADESGLIKVVGVETGKPIGTPWGVHSRAHGVQRLCWAGIGATPEASVAAVTKQGVVQTWDPKTCVATSATALNVEDEAAAGGAADEPPANVIALQCLRERCVCVWVCVCVGGCVGVGVCVGVCAVCAVWGCGAARRAGWCGLRCFLPPTCPPAPMCWQRHCGGVCGTCPSVVDTRARG